MTDAEDRAMLSRSFVSRLLSAGRLPVSVRIVMSLLLMLLFGLNDLLVLCFSRWPHLYGILGVPIQRWEEVVVYAPFAQAFDPCHVPVAAAPVYDKLLAGPSVYPWLTHAVLGLIYRYPAWGHIDLYLLICHTLLPVVCFWLMYAIYNRFIFKTWAILLAFLGVTYFSGFHYISGLMTFVGWSAGDGQVVPYALPEIARTPFPSISLIGFLIAFYFTIRTNLLQADRVFFLSLLWAVQLYIYPLNFVAGSVFFVLWMLFARYMTDRQWCLRSVFGSILIFLAVSFVLIMPYLASLLSPEGRQLAAKLGGASVGWWVTTDWGLLLGYGLPILLLAISFFLFRGDYYELLYRCAPVLILLVADLLVSVLHTSLGHGDAAELHFHRISNIFCRFFFFIPFLYFISLPVKPIRRGVTRWQQLMHQQIPDWLHVIFHRWRIGWCVLGIVLLSLFILLGDIHNFNKHERYVADAMAPVDRQIRSADKRIASPGALVVYDELAANLVAPAMCDQSSLLVSTFGNFVDDQLLVERVVLYAKLMGWDQQQLVAFVSPTPGLTELASYRQDKQSLLFAPGLERGLGYWLINHRKPATRSNEKNLAVRVLWTWRVMTTNELLRRHPVHAIVTREPGELPITGRQVQCGDWTIVFLEKVF